MKKRIIHAGGTAEASSTRDIITSKRPILKRLKREWPLHVMLIPGMVFVIVFSYIPMAGLIIAFENFTPAKGMFGNQTWVGLDNFRFLFSLPNTWNVIRNTVTIAVGKIILNLIVPIVAALLLNEVGNIHFKKLTQTIIYFPHFISWIILSSILIDILSPNGGAVNKLLGIIGIGPFYYLGSNDYFQGTMIWADVWKNFGYGTIVYLASITSIDPTLYDAAAIDGAGRWQQTRYVTLPGMRGIIVLMMVLSMGNVLNAGFDEIFNLYSPAVYETGDILDTMIYRMGLENAQYGVATAAGLLKSIISLILISTSYWVADKFFDYRLF